MNRTVLIVIWSMLILAPTSFSQAQTDGPLAISQFDDGSGQLETLLEKHTKHLKIFLECRVEKISQCCQLTNKQKNKLKVAIKGVAKRFTDTEKVKAKLEIERFQAQINKLRGNSKFFVFLNISHPIEVANQTRWQNAITNTLTAIQNRKLQLQRSKNQQLARELAVEHLLIRLESNLVLTSSQSKKIRDVIEKNFGDRLAIDLLSPYRKIQVGGRFQEFDVYVKHLLTKEQLDVWRNKFVPFIATLPKTLAAPSANQKSKH